jgi:hypothetical protein
LHLFIILLPYVWFEHPGHTYGGFVPSFSERGVTSLIKLLQNIKWPRSSPSLSTSKGCYNIDINASCYNIEKVLVETCDETITQENEQLKREVKKLELELNKLQKQTKVQPPQDNRINMVKKLEKERTAPKLPLNHQRSKFKRRGMKK